MSARSFQRETARLLGEGERSSPFPLDCPFERVSTSERRLPQADSFGKAFCCWSSTACMVSGSVNAEISMLSFSRQAHLFTNRALAVPNSHLLMCALISCHTSLPLDHDRSFHPCPPTDLILLTQKNAMSKRGEIPPSSSPLNAQLLNQR